MKSNFAGYCPLLLDGDILALNPDLVVRGQRIYDGTTGALHCLRPEGEMVMNQLAQKTTFKQLRQNSTELGVHQPQLADLLGFLNLIGCIKRDRPWATRPRGVAIRIRHWHAHKPLYKRTRASLASLAAQTLFVCWPIVLASMVVSTLMAGAGILPSRAALGMSALWSALLIISIYLHEVAHFAVLRAEDIPADTIRHGMRIGLLHRSLDPATEIFLALAGPVSGAACSALGFIVCRAFDLAVSPAIFVVIALLHLCSLLPWYGDGVNLRFAFTARRSV